MRKLIKGLFVLGIVAVCIYGTGVLKDRQSLRSDLIRLHVVADSDSEEDQAVKLQVRDAVIAALQDKMDSSWDASQAKAYLQAHLEEIQAVANETLEALGSTDTAAVTLGLEEFPVRYYDTFTLPSGVYESLRVTIGEGEGKNWWCVVFPSLCVSATSEGFSDTAAAAGFPESLTDTLTGEYEIRFFLLDCLGKAENFLADF